jgi:phosphate transport system substrate-binding protein
MKTNARYFLRILLLGFGVAPFGFSLLCALPFMAGMGGLGALQLSLIYIAYFSVAAVASERRVAKHYPDGLMARYAPVCLPLLLTLAVCAVCMVVSKGYAGHDVFAALFFAEVAFVPMSLVMSLFGRTAFVLIIPLIYKAAFLLFFTLNERKDASRPTMRKGHIAGFLSLMLISGSITGWVQLTRNQTVLPRDYGFAYGGGYASVDIYRYAVWNEDNSLPTLDEPSSFIISDKAKMPVLDGAEAAYPVYSAFASACYARVAGSRYPGFGGDAKEAEIYDAYIEPIAVDNIVTFTNTIYAFQRLVDGDVDIFFGAQPSKAQAELAERAGKRLVLTPIGKEAFVFFVNNANECDGLATQDIRDIYSGKVGDWKPITGKGERIYAFQRPENSGSQTIMQLIMGDAPLAEPLREEYVEGMAGISERVADYRNYPGAIGYSFRFFTTGMAGDPDAVKLLHVDGVAPTTENIASGAYPFTVSLYAISLADNDLETIAPFLAWMQGAEGQELVEKIGYVPIGQ